MFVKLLKDESGVAMGLAVMMIMLIGVMGAGLLVFVRNDLEAVIEVNQGQRAMDLADAGVHAARQQILADKLPAHYDVDDIASSNYLATSCDVNDSTESVPRSPAAENWSPEAGGQTRSFAGGQFTVTIRWMPQNSTADSRCVAPETTASPSPSVEFFQVISTGTYGNATRRIETIQRTYSLNVPKAYYTPGPVTINGDACISNVSIFSLQEVRFAGGGNGCNGTGVNFQGDDLYYGDWNRPPFNTTPRPVRLAGVGTAGEISGGPQMIDPATGARVPSEGRRDFDISTSPPFRQFPATGEMTFPFDLRDQPDADRLCDQAKEQNSYIADPTTSGTTNLLAEQWPGSSPTTVLCYEFTSPGSHTLNWKVDVTPDTDLTASGYPNCEGPIQDGTIVVKGGGFSVSPNTDLFRGVVVVRGAGEVVSEVISDISGRGCLDGFINSTGPITLAGSITPSNSDEVSNRPGFYGVRTWSWRELYE